LLLLRTQLVREIFGFEPNRQAFALLEQNFARLPVPASAYRQALSNFQGRGVMRQPAYDRSQHASFLVENAEGPIDVTTIDRLQLPDVTNLLLKVDVEGGEHALLEGAAQTLRRVRRFLIVLEAHPQVIQRTNTDPIECVRLINTLRYCRVRVAERPAAQLDLDRVLVPQLPSGQVCNLLIESL
jgi:FkbM family methyltransferase